MKTIYPVIMTLAIGTASLMFALSGAGGIFGVDRNPDTTGGDLKQQAANSSVNNSSTKLDTNAQSDGGLFGAVLTGVDTILSTGKLVITLPLALEQIGFPNWFAYPLGLLAQVVTGIGVVQFLSGRVYR